VNELNVYQNAELYVSLGKYPSLISANVLRRGKIKRGKSERKRKNGQKI
jgi:hypothetical protein